MLTEGKEYTDKELAGLLRLDSAVAFTILLDRYSSRLYRFSLSYLKNKEDAEEIVQEVFLKIWQIRQELSLDRPIEALLFTMAKNGILNTIRKQKSERTYLDYAALYPEKNILVDEEIDFRELEKVFRQAYEQLSPGRKEIFGLSRYQFLSNAEIAAKLGISIKTVENQMTAALAQIRRALHSKGFSLILFDLFHKNSGSR